MTDPDRPSRPPERTAKPVPSDPAHAVAGRSAPVGEIGRELGDLDFEPDDLLASLRPFEPNLSNLDAGPDAASAEPSPRSSALGAPRLPRLEPTSSPDPDYDEAAQWDAEPELAQAGAPDPAHQNPETALVDAAAGVPELLLESEREAVQSTTSTANDKAFEADETPTRVLPPIAVESPSPPPSVPVVAPPPVAVPAPRPSAAPSVPGVPKRPLVPRPLLPRQTGSGRVTAPAATSLRTTAPEPATTPGIPSKAPSTAPDPSLLAPGEAPAAVAMQAPDLDGPDVVATDDAAVLEQLVDLPPDRMEALVFEAERPAREHLEQAQLTDAFRQLAAVLSKEAQARRHPHEQADLAVVYGETLAMLGELDTAREHLPALVSTATPATLLLTRQLAFATEDVTAYARAIKAELRGSISPESRRHLMALYCDLLQQTAEGESESRRHLELSSRAFPSDLRFLLKRLAVQLSDRTSGKIRVPNLPDSPQLNEAIADLAALRSGSPTLEVCKHPAGVLMNARRAWRQRDLDELLRALSDFQSVDALAPAATWLFAAWTTYCPRHREAGTALLDRMAEQGDEEAEAALIERRLHGSVDMLTSVEAFSTKTVAQLAPVERLSLGVALGAPHDTLQLLSNAVTPQDSTLPLIRAVQGLYCLAPSTAEPLDGAELRLAVGQALGRVGASVSTLDEEPVGALGPDLPVLLDQLERVDPGSPLVRALRLCATLHGSDDTALAEAVVGALPEFCTTQPAHLSLLGALLANLAGDTILERELLKRAMAQEPPLETAYQARVAQDRTVDAALIWGELTARLDQTPRRAWLELMGHYQARHQCDGLEHFVQSLTSDDTSFGALGALLLATAPKPSVVGWSRLATSASSPEVRTFSAILEALGHDTSWSSPHNADNRFGDVAQATKDPLAGALMNGLSGTDALTEDPRLDATAAEPALSRWLRTRRLLVKVPFELDSVPVDELITCQKDDPTSLFASVLRQIPTPRCGDSALFEQDLAAAESCVTVVERSEALWALSERDPDHVDGLGSVNVARRIVARDPRHLPALRLLERHAAHSNDPGLCRDVAEQLATELGHLEALAHGWLALAASAYDPSPTPASDPSANGLLELLDRAAKQAGPLPLWVLRRSLELARNRRDDDGIIRQALTLSGTTTRAFDAATLLLRAAEAASRLERWDSVGQLLAQAVELCPEHLVALSLRAEFLEVRGEVRHAASAYDALAEAACMPTHKVAAWLHAADLYSSIPHEPELAERARTDLERVVLLDPTHADATLRLKAVYAERHQPDRLEALLTQLLLRVDDPKERAQLELERARVLIELDRIAEAQGGLERVLSLFPDEEAALNLAARLYEQQADYEEAEQKWLRLATLQTNEQHQADAYERLATLYETHLEQPARAETAYREVLRRRPDAAAGDQLVQLLLRNENPAAAAELLQQLLSQVTEPSLERSRSLQLARLYDERFGDRRRAEEILERTRRKWPNDAATVGALADFYRRGRDFVALGALLDRSLVEARRALASGRFDPAFFELIACVAEQRELADLVKVTNASLSAIVAQPYLIEGIGLAAAEAGFADSLAPEVLSLPLRALLRQTGWAMSAAHPVQLRALRASDLTDSHPELSTSLRSMAQHFGVEQLELYLSPALGIACQVVSSRPAILVVGPDFAALEDHAVRDALGIRALRILSANGAALASTAPVDLWPLLVAYLSAYLPTWRPPGVDQTKIAALRERIERALPTPADPDLATLAADVVASIGNRASQLGIAVQQWGTRTALLALGDPAVILRAIALASGQLDRISEEPAERQKWIVRNPEARDMAIFSVTDAYVEMRAKAFGRR